MNSSRAAVVLAAGKGKRMQSDLAKVLHPISGKPLIEWALGALQGLGLERVVVVVGHQGQAVIDFLDGKFPDLNLSFAWQKEQKGTGHAVQMAETNLTGFAGSILVSAGDVPFISTEVLQKLFENHEANRAAATCLTAELADPAGYGRVVREGDSQKLLKIVEHKDADEKILRIREINSGIFTFEAKSLFEALGRVTDSNSQGEYYLTDVVGLLNDAGKPCFVSLASDPHELSGINSVEQLRELERMFPDR